MRKQNITLFFPLLARSVLFSQDKGIMIHGGATFLFVDIFIKKNDNFNINLDKNIKTEKVIISVFVSEYVISTLFFEHSQNNCNNIEVNLYTKKYAQLFFIFFIRDIKQLKKTIAAYPEESSNISIFGSYIAKNSEKINLETYQYHKVKNGSSDVTIRGIATGNSVINHVGYLEIQKEAINTKAHQTSKHIALSKTAKIYAKPILNVLNNKVQCSHASAIGQFAEEQLFYFFARGICKNDAMKLLLESFMHSNFSGYDVVKIMK